VIRSEVHSDSARRAIGVRMPNEVVLLVFCERLNENEIHASRLAHNVQSYQTPYKRG
jgi:tRNA A37 threonylcarbamoyladenosine synthetase subunit TsaC/SUA5/YrdC